MQKHIHILAICKTFILKGFYHNFSFMSKQRAPCKFCKVLFVLEVLIDEGKFAFLKVLSGENGIVLPVFELDDVRRPVIPFS